MANVSNAKLAIVQDFDNTRQRAVSLYTTIVANGYTRNGAATTRLTNPDRRDSAQFIFFELAAAFEDFALNAFQIEVRHRLTVNPQRAIYIMGSIDNELRGVMGWASPTHLQTRARNLFGKNGFFGRLEENITPPTFDLLTRAHKVRNRIAHNGGKAVEDYTKILGNLGVPQASRQGLSVGRLLVDYPTGVAATDRWFHRFAAAYDGFKNAFQISEPQVP